MHKLKRKYIEVIYYILKFSPVTDATNFQNYTHNQPTENLHFVKYFTLNLFNNSITYSLLIEVI